MKSVDFYRDSMEGQMRPTERMAMYEMVSFYKPKNILEIGTWKGGGSTYILAHAASQYGGMVHTIEIDEQFYNHAIKLYAGNLSYLKNNVLFYFGDAVKLIPDIMRAHEFSFVFLDGKEDPEESMIEYNMIIPNVDENVVLACHDWKISKMKKVRETIESDPKWKQIRILLDTDTGFAIYRRGLIA